MKKEFLMTLAAACMATGLFANAPAQPAAAATAQPAAVAAAQPAQQQEKSAATLSADELAFAAKLNDQNRKVFSTQFSAEQRKAAMTAACASGACATGQKTAVAPNDAVQKVLKDSAVVVADKKEVAPQAAAAPAAPAAKPASSAK
jgi:hypothetical protein